MIISFMINSTKGLSQFVFYNVIPDFFMIILQIVFKEILITVLMLCFIIHIIICNIILKNNLKK